MPKLVDAVPKYRLHRASGQALVTIQGKDHYLGPWKSKASRAEYDRFIGEWFAKGRPREAPADPHELTIAELAIAYLKFAKGYYVKDGKPSHSHLSVIKSALRFLRRGYGHTQAAAFGPLSLRAVQERMVEAGHCRRYINANVDRIRRAFKWAAANELISAATFQALTTVPGLKRGRTQAPEPEPVGPVADHVVDATIAKLPGIVADMVRLQRLSACRPAEICMMRPCDVDRTAEVWAYRPQSHKTQHHGRERVIFFGPRAQVVLSPYLLRDAQAYCFAPIETRDAQDAARREARQTPLTPSQAKRRRKRKPKRFAGEVYDVHSYRRAIHRACDRAFPPEAQLPLKELKAWQREHRWSPNRLRHSAATELRSRFGLESAQVVLGHSKPNTTLIYADRDLSHAARIMAEVG